MSIEVVEKNYPHRVAPNGLTILGTDADLAKAQELVGKHSTVYAALRPTEESKSCCFICSANFPLPLLLPCFWPHLLGISLAGGCCILANIKNYQKDLDHTLYVVTNDMVKIHIESHSPPCICCTLCTTGSSSENLLLSTSTIQVNTKGSGCKYLQNCCNPDNAVAELVVAPTGYNVSAPIQYSNKQTHLVKRMYLHNPSEVSKLINDIRAIGSKPQFKTKRVFVAPSSSPTSYQVFMLSDPNSFCKELSAKFFDNNPSHNTLHFTLADVNIPIMIDQIAENDKVIVALQ